jgi:GntR family transcriptional repressor for pyruvate dehydrogenase complex
VSVKATRVSDAVIQEIESMILDGVLKPGERLPPERELAKKMGVSRPSLREAIKTLAARDLVESKRGGGTFVSNLLGPSFSNPLMNLFQHHPETLYDLLEVRTTLEGESAYHAAMRATDADLEIIRRRYDAMTRVHAKGEDAMTNAESDLEFHLAIAEAAHNVVLLYIMRGLFNLLLSSIYTSLEKLFAREGHAERVAEQHQAIFEAIVARDPEAARAAAQAHLRFVEATIREIDQEGVRIKRAQRRLFGFAE